MSLDDDEIREEHSTFLDIYSNQSSRLESIGLLFKNPIPRKMWIIMTNNPKKSYNAILLARIIENKSADEMAPKLPNYLYHLKQMKETGLIVTDTRMHTTKHELKFYRANPFVLIVPDKYFKRAKESKTLQNTFKRVFRLTAVGVATALTFALTSGVSEEYAFQVNSIVYSALVLSGGLILNKMWDRLRSMSQKRLNDY